MTQLEWQEVKDECSDDAQANDTGVGTWQMLDAQESAVLTKADLLTLAKEAEERGLHLIADDEDGITAVLLESEIGKPVAD